MKVITNLKLIKRNKKIGQIATYTSLGVLGIGLLITYFRKEDMTWSLVALVLGFFISQVGIYFGSRWGRSPRPDEKLVASLKGLDDRYCLYNFTSPVPHLLLGPSGALVLVPLYQGGSIHYNATKNRFIQKGGSVYLKLFAQENLGRPDLEAKSNQDILKKFLAEHFEEGKYPEPESVLVFTNPKVVLDLSKSPIPAVAAEKLKDLIRKKSKTGVANLDATNQDQGLTNKRRYCLIRKL